jgi:hypothetical protein
MTSEVERRFWRPGRAITMAVRHRNYELKKKSQFIAFSFIWLHVLKFGQQVALNYFFKFKIFTFLAILSPLTLCCQWWQRITSPRPAHLNNAPGLALCEDIVVGLMWTKRRAFCNVLYNGVSPVGVLTWYLTNVKWKWLVFLDQIHLHKGPIINSGNIFFYFQNYDYLINLIFHFFRGLRVPLYAY